MSINQERKDKRKAAMEAGSNTGYNPSTTQLPKQPKKQNIDDGLSAGRVGKELGNIYRQAWDARSAGVNLANDTFNKMGQVVSAPVIGAGRTIGRIVGGAVTGQSEADMNAAAGNFAPTPLPPNFQRKARPELPMPNSTGDVVSTEPAQQGAVTPQTAAAQPATAAASNAAPQVMPGVYQTGQNSFGDAASLTGIGRTAGAPAGGSGGGTFSVVGDMGKDGGESIEDQLRWFQQQRRYDKAERELTRIMRSNISPAGRRKAAEALITMQSNIATMDSQKGTAAAEAAKLQNEYLKDQLELQMKGQENQRKQRKDETDQANTDRQFGFDTQLAQRELMLDYIKMNQPEYGTIREQYIDPESGQVLSREEPFLRKGRARQAVLPDGLANQGDAAQLMSMFQANPYAAAQAVDQMELNEFQKRGIMAWLQQRGM